MSLYRLVNSHKQYKKYGIERNRYSPPPSPLEIYKQGREVLKQEIDNLYSFEDERKAFETQLNNLDNFSNVTITDDNNMQETLLEFLQRKTGATVTESLGIMLNKDISEEEARALAKKRIETKGKAIASGHSRFSDIVDEVNNLVEGLKKFSKEDLDKTKAQENSLIVKINNVLDTIKKDFPPEKKDMEGIDILNHIRDQQNFWQAHGKGLTLRKDKLGDKKRKNLIEHMETLKVLMDNNPAKIAGEVGELYAEKVLAGLTYNINKNVSECVILFSKQTGADSSAKLMDKQLAKDYAYLAKQEVLTSNGYQARFGGYSQDKVDVELTLQAGQSITTRGLSVKNYINPTEITILQGNLLSILGQTKYTPYTYHFINSYTFNKDIGETFSQESSLLYQLMKEISSFHALIGGLVAQIKDGTIIMTPKADYLVVNNSSETQGWKVYSTKNILNKIIEEEENVNKYFSFSRDFNYPRIIEGGEVVSDEKHRFTNMRVELRLKELSKTLT